MGSSLVSLATMNSRIESERQDNLNPPLVFIQGSPSYVSRIVSMFDGIQCHSICAIVGSLHGEPAIPASRVRSVASLHWREVSHKSLAGATTGVFWFGSSVNLAPHGGIARSNCKRTLRHVFKSTLGGVTPRPNGAYLYGTPPLTGSDRARFGVSLFTVEAPSVFAPSENPLVWRDIARSELMDIYDLECVTQRALCQFWNDADVVESLAFTRAAPLKVLHAGASHVLAALSPHGSHPSPSEPSDSEENDDGILVPDISLESELETSSRPTSTFGGSGSGGGAADGAAVGSQSHVVSERLSQGSSSSEECVCVVDTTLGEVQSVHKRKRDGSALGADLGDKRVVGSTRGVTLGASSVGMSEVLVEDVLSDDDTEADVSQDPAPVGQSPISFSSTLGEDDGSLVGAGVGSPIPSDPFGMESDGRLSEVHIKSAKNDDAQVNVEDWDQWTVNSYVPSTSAEAPLICVAGPLTDLQRKSFATIRKGLLFAFKRRLLRSFLRYIHVTHDHGKKVPLQVSYRVRDPDVVDDDGYVVVGGWKSISSTAQVSPWCLSPLRKRRPSKRDKGRGFNTELLRDLCQGADCLERAGHATYWEWPAGSSIFFWRWPSRYKRALCDGTKLWVCDDLPSYKVPLDPPKDPAVRKQLFKKLQVPRSKQYIKPGFVKSRTGYFPVPKGEGDIRIVYDATKCGLNKALWAPNFFLPTIDSLLRNADHHTFYGDIDLGEMFLNYALDEAIRPYAGVEVSALDPDHIRGKMKAVIERWERTLMGLRSSPYVCTQAFSWGEEIIRGKRLDPSNPLRWDRVVLNLPGDESYDPTKPWVYRWNDATKAIAGHFGTYVDDVRTQNHTEASCRATSRKVASGVGYLGQQDAPRKRRPPVRRPGAWSGALCFSVEDEGLYVSCSQEKWDKGKKIIEDLYQDVVVGGTTFLERSRLEKGAGFLVHLSRTFPALFPYFKGIYLTMESWRKGRDRDGWKFSRKGWWNLMAGAFDDEDDNDDLQSATFEERKRQYLNKHQGPMPKKVEVVKRLKRDLTSLRRLFNHATPPKRLVRGSKVKEALYGFGDASGSGFGASWQVKEGTRRRSGTWTSKMDGTSSNHKELKNLVDSLKRMEKEGTVGGTEAFIFTDNSTAEAAFFKGTSASPHLFELILELRELEMRAGCKVHIIHVAGTRMIEQGSDGLSRGNFTEGSMRGKGILEFVPIARSALDRSPALENWFKSWAGEDLEFLDPCDWFERGHDISPEGDTNTDGHWIPSFKPGCFVWTPAPAAAEVAIEELRKARHKRQESYHIFVVPRLMKPYWHKHLCKVSDLILTLPVGHPAWPVCMHEPLTIGICFPYLKHRPWEFKRAPKLLELGRKLHEVWEKNHNSEGPILRKLWNLSKRLQHMPSVVVSEVLQCEHKYKVSCGTSRKRRGDKMEEKERRESFPPSKRRR